MSCVAAQKASANAHSAIGNTPCEGLLSDRLKIQTAMPACASSIQLRRLPNIRVRKGSGTRSTMGDQRNLKEYARPTHDSMPIVARSMPSDRSHVERV